VKSLVTFPQVLTMMDGKLDWTQKLGDAFLAQEKDVMNAASTGRRSRTRSQVPSGPSWPRRKARATDRERAATRTTAISIGS